MRLKRGIIHESVRDEEDLKAKKRIHLILINHEVECTPLPSLEELLIPLGSHGALVIVSAIWPPWILDPVQGNLENYPPEGFNSHEAVAIVPSPNSSKIKFKPDYLFITCVSKMTLNHLPNVFGSALKSRTRKQTTLVYQQILRGCCARRGRVLTYITDKAEIAVIENAAVAADIRYLCCLRRN